MTELYCEANLMDNKKILASISLVIAAVLWSRGLLVIGELKRPGHCRSQKPDSIPGFPGIFEKTPDYLVQVADIGALSYTAIVISFVMANKLTTAANAILLSNITYPCCTPWHLDSERKNTFD